MSVNDLNSIRKLLILGSGWFVGKIPLAYIGRHSCSGAILDEEDFELEEGIEELQNKFSRGELCSAYKSPFYFI